MLQRLCEWTCRQVLYCLWDSRFYTHSTCLIQTLFRHSNPNPENETPIEDVEEAFHFTPSILFASSTGNFTSQIDQISVVLLLQISQYCSQFLQVRRADELKICQAFCTETVKPPVIHFISLLMSCICF